MITELRIFLALYHQTDARHNAFDRILMSAYELERIRFQVDDAIKAAEPDRDAILLQALKQIDPNALDASREDRPDPKPTAPHRKHKRR